MFYSNKILSSNCKFQNLVVISWLNGFFFHCYILNFVKFLSGFYVLIVLCDNKLLLWRVLLFETNIFIVVLASDKRISWD